MFLSVTQWHWNKRINIPRCLLWGGKKHHPWVCEFWHICWTSGIFLQSHSLNMQYVQIQEKPTWNTGVFYFFIARGPILFFVVFPQNTRVFLLENIFVCTRGQETSVNCSMKLFFPYIIPFSHIFLCGGRMTVFLYSHQFANPWGLYMARLMITF